MEPYPHTPLPQLRAARAALHAEGTVATRLLQAPLARSWQRCLAAGLLPDAPGRDAVDHGARLRDALQRQQTLLAHARPVLGFLHEMIGGTGGTCVVADAQGLLLHQHGDAAFLSRARRVALQPGACWAEGVRGTNAIGTALVEGLPVVVHGEEHFLADNGFLTCAAAPVFDPQGRLLGALDVSGDHRGRHPHTLALVRSAVRMLEDRLFLAAHEQDLRLCLHAQPEGLAGVGAALLAVDADGMVRGANGVARQWFGLREADFGVAAVDGLVGLSVGALAAGAGQSRRVQLGNGALLWCRAELPPRRPAAVVVTDVGAGDAAVARARHRAARALTAGLTVLLHGESGTGKDVFARELHAAGPRRRGPFVAVNCASIPESLAEAELFGYVGGAFTGARRDGAPGLFREADGGTLFLDEIGDMPLALQCRLLRVLEARSVTPLGSARAIPVDVQLIAATHRDLRAAVAAGTFRDDLYYRIAGFTVPLPPLRERSDFDALCAAMLAELRPGQGLQLAPGLAGALRRHGWPGNLRQLRSVLTAATALLEPHEREVQWQHLPDDVRDELHGRRAVAAPSAPVLDLRSLSDRAIRDAVAASDGNMSAAARRLGISRNTLYRRLRGMR